MDSEYEKRMIGNESYLRVNGMWRKEADVAREQKAKEVKQEVPPGYKKLANDGGALLESIIKDIGRLTQFYPLGDPETANSVVRLTTIREQLKDIRMQNSLLMVRLRSKNK